MATLAPCSAKRTAIACPIPELPPVTRTFLPLRPGMASVRARVGAVAIASSSWGVGVLAARSWVGVGRYAVDERPDRRAHSAAAAKGTWKRAHHTTTLR